MKVFLKIELQNKVPHSPWVLSRRRTSNPGTFGARRKCVPPRALPHWSADRRQRLWVRQFFEPPTKIAAKPTKQLRHVQQPFHVYSNVSWQQQVPDHLQSMNTSAKNNCSQVATFESTGRALSGGMMMCRDFATRTHASSSVRGLSKQSYHPTSTQCRRTRTGFGGTAAVRALLARETLPASEDFACSQ